MGPEQVAPPPPPGYTAADVVAVPKASAAGGPPPPPPGYSAADVVALPTGAPPVAGMGDLRRAEAAFNPAPIPAQFPQDSAGGPAQGPPQPPRPATAFQARTRLQGEAEARKAEESRRLAAHGIFQPPQFAPDLGPERYGALDQVREVTAGAAAPLGALARAARGVREPVISQMGQSGGDVLGIGKRFQNPPGTPVQPPNLLQRTGEAVADVGGGLTSPENLALIGGMGKLPATAATAADAVFKTQMASGAASKAAEGIEKAKAGDLGGAYQSWIEGAMSGGMAVGHEAVGEAGRKGVDWAKGREAPAPPREPQATPPEHAEPPPPPPPLTIQPGDLRQEPAPPPPPPAPLRPDQLRREQPPQPGDWAALEKPAPPAKPATLDDLQVPDRRVPVPPDVAGLEIPGSPTPKRRQADREPPPPPPGYALEDVVAVAPERASEPRVMPPDTLTPQTEATASTPANRESRVAQSPAEVAVPEADGVNARNEHAPLNEANPTSAGVASRAAPDFVLGREAILDDGTRHEILEKTQDENGTTLRVRNPATGEVKRVPAETADVVLPRGNGKKAKPTGDFSAAMEHESGLPPISERAGEIAHEKRLEADALEHSGLQRPTMEDLRKAREGVKEPITEFSPEASEAQRRAEQIGQPRPKPSGPSIEGTQQGLGLSEDYGRKGDQRDLLEARPTEDLSPARERLADINRRLSTWVEQRAKAIERIREAGDSDIPRATLGKIDDEIKDLQQQKKQVEGLLKRRAGESNEARPTERLGLGRASGDFGKAMRDPTGEIDKSGRPKGSGGGRNLARLSPDAGKKQGPVEAFLSADVKGVARDAVRSAAQMKDDVHAFLSPATRGEAAKIGGGTLRQKNAELALKTTRATRALDDARVAADRRIGDIGKKAALLEFTKPFEAGEKFVGDPRLQKTADALREAMDERVAAVRALGTGKLEKLIENYFPHLWKDVKSAEEFYQGRTLEGGKSFLKKRTIPTIEEGLAAGLEPVDWNPIDLTLRKLHEMDKYVMAHEWLKESQQQGTVDYFPVDRPMPANWTKIDDKIGTVYGSSRIPVEETVDARLYGKLRDLARELGVKTRRETGVDGPAGAFFPGKDAVLTKFGSTIGVLTHELGHAMDGKFNLWDRVTGLRDVEGLPKSVGLDERKKINSELRALAALRHEGTPRAQLDPEYGRYINTRTEKIANLIDAFVNHHDKLGEVAPTVMARLEDVLHREPKIAPLLEMRPTLTIGTRAGSVDAEGLLIKGYYAAPKELAQIVNNHLSPGLQGKALYRGWRAMGNSLNQAQLGLSAFHAGMTSIDAAVSKTALGIRQIARGDLARGLGSVATTPFAPVANVLRGGRAIREAMGDGPLTPDVELVLKAGGRFGQDAMYTNDAVKSMFREWRQGNVIGAGLRAPFALVEAASKPLMEWLVPRQKLGSFLDLARWEVEQLGPDATPEETRHVLGRAWGSIDNRMGQLVYDNLYWNRAAKDLGMASIRSLGWNIGTARELGGAVFDLATIGKRLKDAKAGKLTDPVLTNRMAYAMALPIVVGTMGGIAHYLSTGKAPEEQRDYFFPKTGRKNEDGSDERRSFPSYVKDVAAFKEQGVVKTVGNKLHPLIGTLADIWQNKDFFNTEIRHEDDPAIEQLKQLAEFVAKQFLPISVRNFKDARDNADSTFESALAFGGVARAPKYISQTAAQKEMSRFNAERSPDAPRTREDFERRQTVRNTEKAMRLGRPEQARSLFREGMAAGTVGERDASQIGTDLQGSSLQTRFRHLPIEEKIKVFDLSKGKERDELGPALKYSLEHAYEKGDFDKMPTLRQERLKKQLRAIVPVLYPEGAGDQGEEAGI